MCVYQLKKLFALILLFISLSLFYFEHFLQIGLMGVTFMVGCCYFVQFFRGFGFYVLLVAVGGVVVLFPIDDQVAIIILIRFLTMDLQKVGKERKEIEK